jgi:hypothetical protein
MWPRHHIYSRGRENGVQGSHRNAIIGGGLEDFVGEGAHPENGTENKHGNCGKRRHEQIVFHGR